MRTLEDMGEGSQEEKFALGMRWLLFPLNKEVGTVEADTGRPVSLEKLRWSVSI